MLNDLPAQLRFTSFDTFVGRIPIMILCPLLSSLWDAHLSPWAGRLRGCYARSSHSSILFCLLTSFCCLIAHVFYGILIMFYDWLFFVWMWSQGLQSLPCLSSWALFIFSLWIFFQEHSRFIGRQGKGETFYHFYPLHRHLDISQAINAVSSPLHIASSWTRTGNLWFPSASR